MAGFDMLATRTFTIEDQHRFAALSGDVNPMHLDPLAARRTQAGMPVVHGINALLWVLDQWCAARPDAALTEVAVRFERFIPIDNVTSNRHHIRQYMLRSLGVIYAKYFCQKFQRY